VQGPCSPGPYPPTPGWCLFVPPQLPAYTNILSERRELWLSRVGAATTASSNAPICDPAIVPGPYIAVLQLPICDFAHRNPADTRALRGRGQ